VGPQSLVKKSELNGDGFFVTKPMPAKGGHNYFLVRGIEQERGWENTWFPLPTRQAGEKFFKK